MRIALFHLLARLEERHWWFVGRRRILQRLVQAVVPPRTGSLVVDVGCGTGGNLAALAGDYRCLGIDSSPDAVALARSRFAAPDFICGAVPEDLGTAAAEADLFLLLDVLEHVADDFEFLSRLLAATRPGAHVLITVPANPSLWTEHDVSFGHYRRYHMGRLEILWQGLPVEVRLLSHFNARLYPVIRLVRAVTRRRGRASGAEGTDLTMPPAPVNRILAAILAGEADVLLARLAAGRTRGYPVGASLLALLRRTEGTMEPRGRPAHVPADQARPSTGPAR